MSNAIAYDGTRALTVLKSFRIHATGYIEGIQI